MSKGNPLISTRIDKSKLAEVKRVIARVNSTRKEAPMTVSSFLLDAIKEKLAHMERSRVRKIKEAARIYDKLEQERAQLQEAPPAAT